MKNLCENCQTPTNNKKFCSRKCNAVRFIRKYDLICKNCGKHFTYSNIYDIKIGKMKYCSDSCKMRRYNLDENYFSGPLTYDKMVTLGQIIAIAEIKDYRSIKFFSDIKTLEDISKKLKLTYEMKKSDKGLWRLDIVSDKLVLDLVELGLGNNGLFQDVPDDLWDGLKQTHCWSMTEDGVNIFRTERSKIASWVCDKFSGQMDSIVIKDVFKGVMGCEWVVVWK